MVATNDDIIKELKAIKKLLKGTYSSKENAIAQIKSNDDDEA